MMRFRQTLLLIIASANIAFLGIAGHIQLLQADAQIPRRAVPNPPEKNPKPVMFFNRHLKLL